MEHVDSSMSTESVVTLLVVTTSGEAGFGSNLDGVSGFRSTLGDTRQGLSLYKADNGRMGGNSDELVLPLASKLKAIVSLLLSVSCVSSSSIISSTSF